MGAAAAAAVEAARDGAAAAGVVDATAAAHATTGIAAAAGLRARDRKSRAAAVRIVAVDSMRGFGLVRLQWGTTAMF